LEELIGEADFPEIGAFFLETGAVELVSLLDSEDALDVSRGLLSTRLNEARDLKLVEPAHREEDDTPYTVHRLTALGAAIREQMQRTGLVATHDQLRDLLAEFYEQRAEFREWVQDEDALSEHFQRLLAYARGDQNDDTKY